MCNKVIFLPAVTICTVHGYLDMRDWYARQIPAILSPEKRNDQPQSSDQEGNWKSRFSDNHPRPPADNVIKIKLLMRAVTALI